LTRNTEDYVAIDGAAIESKRAPSCPESSAGSPPVPDRSLKPKINSSTHTPNSPISPPGTTGSNYSSTGNEDKFFPDYPVIAKNPSRNGLVKSLFYRTNIKNCLHVTISDYLKPKKASAVLTNQRRVHM